MIKNLSFIKRHTQRFVLCREILRPKAALLIVIGGDMKKQINQERSFSKMRKFTKKSIRRKLLGYSLRSYQLNAEAKTIITGPSSTTTDTYPFSWSHHQLDSYMEHLFARCESLVCNIRSVKEKSYEGAQRRNVTSISKRYLAV
ncbi:hypothetical protein BA1DRAFT_03592 [Photorhabdus aegyptia]|uniref:Uncharacterized protein n=1 Tax=Photorhabdus aegyptia TaxID=2805098 RepID=A0A022PCK8_9GAMM|nr:hypothetical protein BA1DRAFT_03592 [Photorhabdus aegyptia]